MTRETTTTVSQSKGSSGPSSSECDAQRNIPSRPPIHGVKNPRGRGSLTATFGAFQELDGFAKGSLGFTPRCEAAAVSWVFVVKPHLHAVVVRD
jgi:hypothetical protein